MKLAKYEVENVLQNRVRVLLQCSWVDALDQIDYVQEALDELRERIVIEKEKEKEEKIRKLQDEIDEIEEK